MFKMADEETITDSELRKELKKYGETPGPITASTRSIWLRKWKSLKAGESSMLKPSSPTKKVGRTRRSTPQSSRLAGFSSGEEDDMFSSARSSPKAQGYKRPPHNSRGPNDVQDDTRKKSQAPESMDRHSEHAPKPPSTNASSRAYHTSEPKRSRVGQNDIDGSPQCSGAKSRLNVDSSIDEAKAKLAQRKSRMRFSPGQAEALLMQDRVNQGLSSQNRTDNSRRSFANSLHEGNDQEEELYVGFETSRDDFLDWLLQIPVLLVIGSIVACFIGVAVYVWSQPNSLPEIAFQSPSNKRTTNEFLSCLHQKVTSIVGEADCGYRTSRYLHGSELENVAEQCFSDQSVDIVSVVSDAMKQAITKESSIFRVESPNGELVEDEKFEIDSIQITSPYSNRPPGCRIKHALYLIFMRLLMVLSVLGLCMGTYYSWKRRWMLDDEETREMFILVDHIIDALRKHHEASQHETELPPYLPIPHVRDMLIPPLERKKKARVWKKAVEFLSSTDSRIRVETQTIAGEDYEVWRWIGVLTPNLQQKSESPNHLNPDVERGKYWQGPAFAKLEQVVRLPIVTPTPCLKIRCMHGGPTETEADWDLKIRDALLEKCKEDGSKILHIFVDKTSTEGCVYVKCESLDSAGKAFRSIYANWFDGRLLVVKFVTLKRYHQRFPEALTATTPLQPSGRFPSSLEWFSEDTVD